MGWVIYSPLKTLYLDSVSRQKLQMMCLKSDKSDAFILPGVGAFGKAMSNLKSLKLIDPIKEQILSNKKPILGICLGMQLLADNSEEKAVIKVWV